ncbi:MAG TPA: ABC transporter ATP-binding protein [Candidatus Dormibacteraeota bacterium]|nr:ABC transporter ATP-binding protein [Candidatus Dormibacteraeota bacterium]
MSSALELRGIVKTFGGLRANDGVDLAVEWGQVHALLGENGAGKSTLMNVVYGLTSLDSGEILFDGKPVSIRSTHDAIALGIGMVHQHFMLIPPLTVAENIMLGREITRPRGWIDLPTAYRTVSELAARYGLDVEPSARVESLSVGVQQRVEILKALYRGARLLILDEPTAVLTPQEIAGLFEIVRNLTDAGNAVIFITHKLAEVMEVADRITVMRRGKVVESTTPGESSQAELARMMVGRPVLLRVDKQRATPGDVRLQVEGLVVTDDRRQVAVEGVSLEVRAGEIVGIAGVEGNGQDELVEAISGLRTARRGRVLIQGRDMTRRTTRLRLRGGLSVIPADRHRQGVILELPIADNLVLEEFDRRPFANWMVRNLRAVVDYASGLIKEFDIRATGPNEVAGSLSGGNQQKVVVARELGTRPEVLVASQPTRGIDVGSIEFIHRQIVEQRDKGLAVLLVSSELDEVLSLSDRIAVIYRGRIVAVLDAEGADREHIGLLMAGGKAA